jgi:RNA polymerase sigma-70 factor (ECF subfamily)
LRSFHQLSSDARSALLLSGLEGRSHRQIATQLGIAEGAVKSRVSRGRAALAQLLEMAAKLRRSESASSEAGGRTTESGTAWKGQP